MEDNTAVAVEVTDNVAALLSVLGFAHAAVQNDAAWAAVYEKIAADHADDPDPEDDRPAESGELRTAIHAAVDAVMDTTRQALVMHGMSRQRQELGSPEQPAELPAYDDSRMYL